MVIRQATPPQSSPGRGRKTVRALGELLMTAGLVVLLFVVYELYVTDLVSARKQAHSASSLENDWAKGRQLHSEPSNGQAFAKIYVPGFGADYHFTIQQGTDDKSLEIGPGHYEGTALPGEPGNFAIAGHRVGKGEPFNDLDLLSSCDAIVIETRTDFFVYRVLPYADEVAGWAAGKGRDPKCVSVTTLRTNAPDGGPYGRTLGREVVSPDQVAVIAPVPHKPADVLPPAQEAALLTLTTCHPQFSDRQRLIVHAVLTTRFLKQNGPTYTQLLQSLGEG